MDGENNGKPYEQTDDLGVPPFLETPISLSKVDITKLSLSEPKDCFLGGCN